MATSFLQFCATCEKQIIVPDNSVLYCSQRCHQQDNNKPLSAASTPASETSSSSYISHELSSSEYLLLCTARPSHLLTRSSTTGLPRHRRHHYQPDADSDAARYLSQFASLPSRHSDSRARRRPLASRSATSISTIATSSTVTSMTTSSAPSLTHTPASSLGASAPVSPTRKLSTFSLHHHPSSYFCNAALPTTNTRSIDLVTPVLTPSGGGSTPASVPTITLETEIHDEPPCKPSCDCICETNHTSGSIHSCVPAAAATSMPACSSTTRRNLSPFGFTPNEELVYSKRETPQKQGPVEGSLKQLLTTKVAQMSL